MKTNNYDIIIRMRGGEKDVKTDCIITLYNHTSTQDASLVQYFDQEIGSGKPRPLVSSEKPA